MTLTFISDHGPRGHTPAHFYPAWIRVLAYRKAHPTASGAEIATAVGCAVSTVYQAVNRGKREATQ